MGGVQITLKKEEDRQKKTIEKWRRKKNEEYKESGITTVTIFGFNFYIKNYFFARKTLFEKSNLYHHAFYL